MPESLFDSGRTLSVHILDLTMNVAGAEDAAYATALVLVFSTIFLNGVAKWCAGFWSAQKAF
jgi:phosphate transport system permease protein